MNQQPHVIIINSVEDFAHQVLEQSQQRPVLVDFWAAWCQPCQTLTPILYKLAEEYNGQFVLAKVNADEQQHIAAQFGVRSLPSLKLVVGGELVDELMGAQPEQVIRQMLAPYISSPNDQFRLQADNARAQGDFDAALSLLKELIQAEPENCANYQQYLDTLIDAGRYADAEELISELPANIQADAAVEQVRARLSFAKEVNDAPSVAELEALLASEPDNLQARQQLSAHYVLRGQYEAAMELLLDITRRDRSFGDDAGRKGLLAVFTLLGAHPLVSRYRSKLSTLLY